jgi:LPS export ABC transporter protein LptC
MNRYGYFKIILTIIFTINACTNDMAVINKIIDPEEEPDHVATNIEVLYSDSARLQMKLTAPLTKLYQMAKEPRDDFPEGIHVWIYKKTGELEAEITANWATHNATTNIWEARSNVVITAADGRVMESEQFFWDQSKGEVYSNIFTRVTMPNGTVQMGEKGMWARQDFTKWRLIKGKGAIVLDEEKEDE